MSSKRPTRVFAIVVAIALLGGTGLSVHLWNRNATITPLPIPKSSPQLSAGENPGIDRDFEEQARRAMSENVRDHVYQALFQGMTAIAQPEGYTNYVIYWTTDQRFAAFRSRKDSQDRIIVRDTKTGSEDIVPAPQERLYKQRHPAPLGWADDNKTLYIMEGGTSGDPDGPDYEKDPDEIKNELAKEYGVLYRWRVGDPSVSIIDRSNGPIMDLSQANDELRVVIKVEDGVVVRKYHDGTVVSSQMCHIAVDGKAVNVDTPQLLSKQGELWFATKVGEAPKTRSWLAVIDVNDPKLAPKLIVADGLPGFRWMPDGQQLLYYKFHDPNAGTPDRIDLYHLRRDALTTPKLLASVPSGPNMVFPEIAGVSPKDNVVYFHALAEPELDSREKLFSAGSVQIYQYAIPN